MRRRSFLKSCAAFVAGCALGVGVEISHIKKAVATAAATARVNPAWVTAPYEAWFIISEDSYGKRVRHKFVKPVIAKRPAEPPKGYFRDRVPMRFNANMEPVAPYETTAPYNCTGTCEGYKLVLDQRI